MKRRLFLPGGPGEVSHVWEDDGAGGGLIHSVQDLEPVLEANKAMALANDGYSPDRTLRRVAHIPAILRQHWQETEGWDAWRPDLYGDRLVRKLNDPDWRHLRTAEGRVAFVNGRVR